MTVAPLPAGAPVDVSIVVPTRNEAPNVDLLLDRLEAAMGSGLPGLRWEVIFVDDSDDTTPAAIRAAAASGRPVRLHHRRPGARPGGLGGAVEDGFALAAAEVVAVMDADLQHPPEVLPRLLRPVLDRDADLVSGSRFARSGDLAGLDGPWRRAVAGTSRAVVHRLLPASRPLSDPMSGLFAFRRDGIDGVALQTEGFKILLEVAARGRFERIGDVTYAFDRRHAGRSKASLREGLRFARHLVRLARAPAPAAPVAGAVRGVVGP